VPAGHSAAVGDVEPVGHEYPAEQAPVQLLYVPPAASPKRPAAHSPLQRGEARAGPDQNVPAGQGVHAPAPASLYCPVGHMSTVALVEPGGHAYPGRHGPLQVLLGRPRAAPNTPAGGLRRKPKWHPSRRKQ
jgi:hypothetical protein